MDLSTSICGLELENPLMPASGPLVGDFDKIMSIASFGVGALVTKTISSKAAVVPRPCIYGDNNKIMNAELWSEFPPEEWLEEILPKLKAECSVPIIVSVGYSKDDMNSLIPKLNEYADAFEVSTHYVGKDLDVIARTVKSIRNNTDKPFFMKISPHIPDVVGFAKMAKENGASGIVAINSLGPSMIIDIEKRKVLLGNEEGEVWTSGPSIKPIALAIVNKIKEAVPDFTIIGVGGVSSAKDVIEFLLAGADAVQMLSSAMIKGKDLYEKIIRDLPKTLQYYGFNSIQEVIDAKLIKEKIRFNPKYPKIELKRCIGCNLCARICPYFAMKVDKKAKVDIRACFGCGLCELRCPVSAISGIL
ncbi:4Fe-4S binding protein [Clostridium algoriphilum]|uniref:4Fe-4S binding protein n=1 Tax=Clostridium algoriphilum TaxID=198347 RepID=UPI001CF3CE63|nr:4Fe-4S binding protein [Clostridium algoriphilum]MCB2293277.1 4Fe-4S binding protein [Clostridium algoriphilum]